MSTHYGICNDAERALKLFEKGTPIETVLSLHSLNYYSNSNTVAVWITVFEKYEVAVRAIELKGIYALFMGVESETLSGANSELHVKLIATLAIMYMSNKTSSTAGVLGLTLEETAQAIRDSLKNKLFLRAIQEAAQQNLQQRIEIDNRQPQLLKNPIWVEQARTVKKIADKLFAYPI